MSESRGFDSDFMQKLRDANDLVTVASKYCVIKRQGRKFWACCPFHHERTPSFCMNNEEQFYHCFGCGESGDVITFIQKMESLDFLDAVKYLADRSGIRVPEFKGEKEIFERKQKKERLLSLLKVANEYYKQELFNPNSKEAHAYIKERKLTSKEVEKFEIGYSSSWEGIARHLQEKGFTESEMAEVGIAFKDEYGKMSDFFGLRLMFPLFNKFGDCVGFSGRDIRGKSKAKYKNSIQSLVFDKSSTVFALNHVKALKHSTNIDHIIICEGQMDVIAMHKAGFNTAVACLGTALTEIHAKELKRVCDKVVLCLDADSAGTNATLKAIPVLEAQNLEVRVVQLKGGKDPDEIIKENGVDYMSSLINSAMDSVEFQIKAISKQYDVADGVGKNKFLKDVFMILKNIPTKSGREYYIPLISQISKVPQNVIREDVSDISFSSINAKVNSAEQNMELPHKADSLLQAQIFVLASLIENKSYAKIDEDNTLLLKDNDLIKLLEYIKSKRQNQETINKVIIYDMFGDSSALINQCFNYDFEKFKEQNLEEHYNQCLNHIKSRQVEFEIEQINAQISNCADVELKRQLIIKLSEKIKEKQKLK